MKILIIGANSYIGENFARHARTQGMDVDIADSHEGYKTADYAIYDSVLFAAGIAHRKQTKANKHLYFEINKDLAVKIAKKTTHFIYLSSMAVFGKKTGEISTHTQPKPAYNDYYGMSKFEAENELKAIKNIKLAIIRPPMVYGESCPGRYAQLERLAKFLRFAPCSGNTRSVIYIDTLCKFLCNVIKNQKTGVFHPQDTTYASTSGMIQQIRATQGKKTAVFNAGLLLRVCMAVFPMIKTAYGSLYYSKEMSEGD